MLCYACCRGGRTAQHSVQGCRGSTRPNPSVSTCGPHRLCHSATLQAAAAIGHGLCSCVLLLCVIGRCVCTCVARCLYTSSVVMLCNLVFSVRPLFDSHPPFQPAIHPYLKKMFRFALHTSSRLGVSCRQDVAYRGYRGYRLGHKSKSAP
jgi:hypothetical protein